MSIKKVCVSGDKGFIGRALRNELERQGHVVISLESWIFDRERYQDRLHEYLVNINPEAIFHVGACADTLSSDVSNMMKLNVESTMIMSDWAKFKNIPFIFSSSASIYGNKDEPQNLYAWSKYISDRIVSQNGQVSLRYFNVYGMDERHKGKMASMIYQIYNKHINGEKIYLFPNNPMRDFVYVKDVISANLYAWNNYEMVKGMSHDVGSGIARSFENICEIIGAEYEYTSEDAIPKGYQMFTQAAERMMMKDWHPKYTLELGIVDYMNALKISDIHF
jgi:ADP-L-glycero-D-manno-heptose 6-epimerase